MSRPNWLVNHYHEAEQQDLSGVKVRDILSINDGDVCNASVTQVLLNRYDAPVCVDIGGDVGWWSTFCLEQSTTAKLYTFEPNPISFNALKARFEKEPRIELFKRAVSDKEGELLFSFDGPQSNSREGGIEPVKTTTLDFIPKINILKIDTEGHEVSILNALKSRFSDIDSIIFEFTPYWYGSSEDECIERSLQLLRDLASSYKYMYTLSRRGNPIIEHIDDDDYIFQYTIWSYKNRFQSDIVCSRTPITLEF
jgi:FkbM family methyltransferase